MQLSLAQNNVTTILKTTKIVDFGVDADINSGILSFSESDGANTDDWFLGPNGGNGVINTLNQASSDSLNAGFNIQVQFRMSQTANPNWLDAVYLRDYYSHNNEKDNTIFGGGNDKNYDDPTTWTIKKGSVPPKNDIIDVYGHLRTDSNLTDLWVFGAVSTRTQNGDNYIDFEYFRKPIKLNPNSQNLISKGQQNGHTAYKFNLENGSVITDGDVILSVNYINGGSLAEFRFYAWIDADELKRLDGDPSSLSDADFIFYNENLLGKRFDFGYGTEAGNYESYSYEFYNSNNDPNSPYGYARISLLSDVTANPIFAQDNTVDNVEAPAWGTIGPDGNVSNSYVSPSFIEFALNASLLGLDSNSTNGNCSGPLGHVLVKSRASASFTSELKDLAGPFTLGANSKNTISISKPEMLTCSVTEITLTALTSENYVSNYEWFKDNVSFDDSSPGDNSLTVTQPGNYYVKISFSEGCEIKSNEVKVIQNSIEPNVSALGGVIICSIGQIQLNGTISSTNPNANLIFEWSGPNGFINTTELNPFVNIVGTYTLTVTDIDNGCTSFASAEVTSESIIPLEIQCPPAVEVQCREDIPQPNINAVIIINGGEGGQPVVNFVSDVSDNGSCPEIITRTYGVSDACGNSVYCTQIITVNDTISPEIVDVADYQLEGCATEWPEFLTTTWSDNCSTGGSIDSDAGIDKGSSTDGSIEYREYTFTVKDACDNTATETTLVSRIIGSTPLEIQCPPAVEVQCREDIPQPDINAVIIINGGEGEQPVVNFVSDVSDNGSCPEIITRTYGVSDACGNVVYCTQIITVNDMIDPEILDVADHQLEGCTAEWPEFLTTTWSDNCSAGGSINSDAGVEDGTSEDGCIQYRKYTFTVIDNCQNTDTETTRVGRIGDEITPDILDIDDYQLEGCDSSWPDFLTTTWTDNCSQGGSIDSDAGEEYGLSPDGTIEYRLYTFTVTDDCENTSIETTRLSREVRSGEKIIGDSIELCRDFGEFDLNFLLPDDYKNSGGTWSLYSTEPQGLNISIDSGKIFVHQDLEPGEYLFHYSLGCPLLIEVKVILLDAAPPCVLSECKRGEISTAVTPNGDNVNETFDTGLLLDESCTVDVQIFNRWGAKVFEAQNYQNDWKGTVPANTFGSSKTVTTGTYYYILRYKTDGKVEQTVTGYFYMATE